MIYTVFLVFALSACSRAELADDDATCTLDESGSCMEATASTMSLLQTKMVMNAIQQEQQTGAKILVLGDSGAQMSCQDIGRFCGGSQLVVNKAVGGSRASHWANGRCPFGDAKQGQAVSNTCPPHVSCCNATRAFDPKYGSGYTHVWLSIGGNDFLDSQPCGSLRGAALSGLIESAITRVRSAGPAGLKIVLTGYAIPADHTTPYSFAAFGCGNNPTDINSNYFEALNGAIKAAVDAQKAKGVDVTFVDPRYAMGATATSYSPKSSHSDAIHLNSKGYCKMFSMNEMQQALGCNAANQCTPLQCDSVPEGFVKDGVWLLQGETQGAGQCAANLPSPACTGAGKKPAPPPATASPTTQPTAAPSLPCKNDDKAIADAAKGVGVTISGCDEVGVANCQGQYGETVRKLCPKMCNTCGVSAA